MTYLIVGLGNIGAEYAQTRHNMGFMVLDAWAKASNISFETKRYGDIAELSIKGRKFVLLKPSTYMNLSGNAVRYWLDKLKIGIDSLIVLSDDLNIEFGNIRMRKKGSDGGHNGLKNINELLGTQDYPRIRIGIGNNYLKGQQVDFVLGRLSEEELSLMPQISKKIINAIIDSTFIGIDKAMSQLNGKISSLNG